MRNHQPSHSASLSGAVLRTPSAKRKKGVGAMAVAAVICLHAIALYVGLRQSTSVLTVPDKQPSTLTFELSAPAQPEVEAPGPVAPQPIAPPAPPKPEPKPVAPAKPTRSVEPKKKPAEKKPVEKPAPAKPAEKPAKAQQTPTPSVPATSQSQAELPQSASEQSEASSASAPAGTGGQKLATVPAQVGQFQANNPHPKYPMQARRRRMEGLVILTVRVNEDGRVADARVKATSGYELLDNSALETVRLWRFEPGRQGASVMASWTDVRINFHLN